MSIIRTYLDYETLIVHLTVMDYSRTDKDGYIIMTKGNNLYKIPTEHTFNKTIKKLGDNCNAYRVRGDWTQGTIYKIRDKII